MGLGMDIFTNSEMNNAKSDDVTDLHLHSMTLIPSHEEQKSMRCIRPSDTQQVSLGDPWPVRVVQADVRGLLHVVDPGVQDLGASNPQGRRWGRRGR